MRVAITESTNRTTIHVKRMGPFGAIAGIGIAVAAAVVGITLLTWADSATGSPWRGENNNPLGIVFGLLFLFGLIGVLFLFGISIYGVGRFIGRIETWLEIEKSINELRFRQRSGFVNTSDVSQTVSLAGIEKVQISMAHPGYDIRIRGDSWTILVKENLNWTEADKMLQAFASIFDSEPKRDWERAEVNCLTNFDLYQNTVIPPKHVGTVTVNHSDEFITATDAGDCSDSVAISDVYRIWLIGYPKEYWEVGISTINDPFRPNPITSMGQPQSPHHEESLRSLTRALSTLINVEWDEKFYPKPDV